MKIEKKKKIINILFNVIGFVLLLLLIILTPIMTEVVWINEGMSRTIIHAPEIALIVVTCSSYSGLSFLTAYIFRVYTKEVALKNLEKDFNYGLIDIEHYKTQYKHIEMFWNLKNELRAEIKLERKKLQEEVRKQADEAIKKVKGKVDEKDKEELMN